MSRYVAIGKLSEVPVDRPLLVIVGKTRMCVWRHEGGVVAYQDACPHEGNPLSEEGLATSEGAIMCTAHGWRFDRATGACIEGAAGLRRYDVKLEGDTILLRVG